MSKSIKILKTLHLASFNGNIGDLANHKGAKRIFSNIWTLDLNIRT